VVEGRRSRSKGVVARWSIMMWWLVYVRRRRWNKNGEKKRVCRTAAAGRS
jgi:hypothetical protein